MKKRYESLDAFRGICAICVVLFHLHVVGSITDLSFFKGSDIFVEFFFCLSGFVLAHGYAYKDGLKFIPYMYSRFVRLYPLHIFMLIVFIALEICKLVASKYTGIEFNTAPFSGANSVSEIIPNALLIHSWSWLTNSLSFNYPSWSISIEFYMYAILFSTIFSFKKYKVYSWVSIALIGLALSINNTLIPTPEVIRGVMCFFSGAAIYSLHRKIPKLKLNKSLATIIEISLLSLVIYFVSLEYEDRYLLCIPTFLIVIMFFSYESGFISSILKKPAFQYVGKLSYSIYMTHAAVIFMLMTIMVVLQKVTGIEFSPMIEGSRKLTSGNVHINNIIVMAVISLVVLISNITYKNIEFRFLKYKKKFD